MDQRGTGCSSAITAANLAAKGSAEQQASYLKHFRYKRADLCIRIFMQAGVQTFSCSGIGRDILGPTVMLFMLFTGLTA